MKKVIKKAKIKSVSDFLNQYKNKKYYFVYAKFPKAVRFRPYSAADGALVVNKVHATVFSEDEIDLVLAELIKCNSKKIIFQKRII